MPDEVVTTPFGKFLIDPRDLIGSTTKAGTLWDGPGFLQVIAKAYGRRGTPGITILDVGANQGMFSVWLAARGAWRVVAVEPVPAVMQRLKANLDLNQASCADVVIPIEVAAYDGAQPLSLQAVDRGNFGGTTFLPVATFDPSATLRGVCLDDYRFLWQRGVSLIKIDTEGCDGRVILGLAETIVTHRPALVFEYDPALAAPHNLSFPALVEQFDRWHYAVHPWPSQPNNYLALPEARCV